MLQDLLMGNRDRRASSRRSRQIGATDGKPHHRWRLAVVVHHDEAEDHSASCSPPRCGVDEERFAHQVPGKAGDNVHRVVVVADLDVPRVRPARSCQLGLCAAQTEDEDLSLDRALGVERRNLVGLRG